MVSQSSEASQSGASSAPNGSGGAAVAVSNISHRPEGKAIAIYQAGKKQQLQPSEQYDSATLPMVQPAQARHADHASKQFDFSALLAALSSVASDDAVGVLLSLSRAAAGNFFALPQDSLEVGFDGEQGIIRVFGPKEAVMAFLGEIYFYGNQQALQHFYVDVKILPSGAAREMAFVSSALANDVASLSAARVFMLYESGSGFYVAYQGSGSSGIVPAGSDLVTIATPDGPLLEYITLDSQSLPQGSDPLFDAPAQSSALPHASDPNQLIGAASNAAPNAVDDVFATKVGNALTVNGAGIAPAILSNDTDPNNNSLVITAIGAGSAGGALANNSDGTFTYTPPALYIGAETFKYTVSDGALTDTATITFNVGENVTLSTTINDLLLATNATGNFSGLAADWHVGDSIMGGAGADTLTLTGGAVNVNLQTTFTNATSLETINLNSNAAHQVTVGDAYYGRGGGVENNQLHVASTSNVGITVDGSLVTGANSLRVSGGSNNDVINGNGSASVIADYSNALNAVRVQLVFDEATGHGTDTLTNINYASGSNFNDTLEGGTGSQTLTGGDGDDVIRGGLDVVNFDVARLGDLFFWYDPSDTSTVTTAAGRITNLADKSASNNDMIALAGDRPQYGVDTIGGRNVITNNAGERLFVNPAQNVPTTQLSLFVVEQTSNGQDRSIVSYASAADNNELLFFRRSVYINDAERGNAITEYRDGETHLLEYRWRNSDGRLETNVDGASQTVNTHAAGVTIDQVAGLSYGGEQDAPGGGFADNQDFVGLLGEAIFFNSYVTDATRDLVNFYLAEKWGLNYTAADNDTLVGGAGNDTLAGGLGADSLTGGIGNDVFLFEQTNHSGVGAGNRDIIADFTTAQDRIDLSNIAGLAAISADNTAGNGIADFTGVAGQVAWGANGAGLVVYVDTNGDSAANMEIDLQNIAALQSSDFIF